MLFEKKEYIERLKKIKISMQKKGIDLLVSQDPANMNYLTGYDAWSFYYAQCVLVHINEDEPICFVRTQDGGGAYIKTYLQDKNIIEYDEKYIHTWPLHPYKYLVEIIKKRKWDNLNIGLEMDSHYFTAFCYETIKKGLPNAKLKDAERLVNWVRVIKSNAEIQKLKHICSIGSATFSRLPEIIEPNMSLEEVFRAFRLEALQQGADDVPYVVGGAEKGGYANVISLPSKRPIKKGDVLMIDSGCVWDGYFCDFDRNWAIGNLDDQSRQVYDVLWRATEAGIEAAKPGKRACDIFLAMSQILCELDVTSGDIGRLGHGLGMQLTEQPSVAYFDETELQENMVLTLEPSISYGDGLMMVHEENVVVTKAGGLLLTKRAPEDMPILFSDFVS